MMELEQDLVVAIAAVRQAACLCQAVQAGCGTGVLEKDDRSPVTVADFGSQALVCRHLAAERPGDPVVGEEAADALREPGNEPILARVQEQVAALVPGAGAEQTCAWIDLGGAEASPRFWTVDPIDGTKGFLRGQHYAVALGLIEDGEVKVAALACPRLPQAPGVTRTEHGVIVSARRGGGAFIEPLAAGGRRHRVAVSAETRPAHARFCESLEAGHSAHDDAARVARALGISAPPVRLDSQAKYAVVARGDAEIYMRLPTRADYVEKIWDHAAGSLIVEEAGGAVTHVDGAPLDFGHGRTLEANRGVLASNGPLHQRLVDTLAELGI